MNDYKPYKQLKQKQKAKVVERMYSHRKEYSSMNYGWATVFTLAAWFAGLVIDVNVRVGDLGLRTVLPVIVMGCCVMKYIKGNSK